MKILHYHPILPTVVALTIRDLNLLQAKLTVRSENLIKPQTVRAGLAVHSETGNVFTAKTRP